MEIVSARCNTLLKIAGCLVAVILTLNNIIFPTWPVAHSTLLEVYTIISFVCKRFLKLSHLGLFFISLVQNYEKIH